MRISDWSSDVCSSDLADRADLAVAAQRRARGADRRLDVAHARILVELAHQPQRTLEFGGDIGIEFDRWLEPPEQVGRQRKIARFGQPVALAEDAGIAPDKHLDGDERRAWRAFGGTDIR